MNISKRQKKIIQLLDKGLRPTKIAEKINVSYSTVRRELGILFDKTNSTGIVQLVLWAYKNKIIEMANGSSKN